jgi:hypothetical protein
MRSKADTGECNTSGFFDAHDLVRETWGRRVSSVLQERMDRRPALRDGGHGHPRHGQRFHHLKHVRPPQLAASFLTTLILPWHRISVWQASRKYLASCDRPVQVAASPCY